jgi:MraZ protein
MASFSGRYLNSVDSKGRVALPAKLRRIFPKESQNNVVLTRGIESCIHGYAMDDWDSLLFNLENLEIPETQKNLISRLLLSYSLETNFDGQGRVLIPNYLLEHAKLRGEAMIVGVGNRFEIWNPLLFEKHVEEAEPQFKEILGTISLSRPRIANQKAEMPDKQKEDR